MLNVVIVVTQTVYGVIAHSTTRLADAGHNLADVLGLLLAWGSASLATHSPSGRYPFGFGSSSILASLANAVLMLLACVAMIGMVVNGFPAWRFVRGQKDALNAPPHRH